MFKSTKSRMKEPIQYIGKCNEVINCKEKFAWIHACVFVLQFKMLYVLSSFPLILNYGERGKRFVKKNFIHHQLEKNKPILLTTLQFVLYISLFYDLLSLNLRLHTIIYTCYMYNKLQTLCRIPLFENNWMTTNTRYQNW